MQLNTTRPRNLSWSCDNCRASHGPTPGFAFYTCLSCDQDFCPKCFEKVEKVIKTEKLKQEDPNQFKEKQIVFSNKCNKYVQIKKFDKETQQYTCRIIDPKIKEESKNE